MKCQFCGTEFAESHSCKVDLSEIPALRAKNALLVKALEEISVTGRTLVSRATGVVCAQIADHAVAAVKVE